VFGEDDPAAVFHRERPIEIKREGRGYALYVKLPFAEKNEIQVYTHGEDLVIQVRNQRRNIALPRTLAGRPLQGAVYADQRLRVGFGERH
jgi:arsenite-transporting ATPase